MRKKGLVNHVIGCGSVPPYHHWHSLKNATKAKLVGIRGDTRQIFFIVSKKQDKDLNQWQTKRPQENDVNPSILYVCMYVFIFHP